MYAQEPQLVPQPQADGARNAAVRVVADVSTAQPLDAPATLAEPLRQLQPNAARDGEVNPSLVQSPPAVAGLRVPSMEKLPSMPEETPDKRKQREKDEIERKRREQESLEFQQRFDLSPSEPLLEDYSCAHTATGAIYQGRLYLSKSYMCFYSPLFSKLLRVNLRKLTEIEKRSTLGVFPNGIEVTTENGKKLSFISFIYRDQAYNTLCKLVKEIVRCSLYVAFALQLLNVSLHLQKELGAAPPPTPHSEELPNIVDEDGQDAGKPRTGSAVRRTLSRSLSTGPAVGIRSSSPLPQSEERRNTLNGESGLRQGTPGLEDGVLFNAPAAPTATAPTTVPPVATPATTATSEAPKTVLAKEVPKDKESVPPAKRPEEPKGGKETIASLLATNAQPSSSAIKTETAVVTSVSASPPAPSALIVTSDANLAAATVLPPPAPVVNPLAAVPVTDKCSHLTPCKSAPVLTHTVPLSVPDLFRRVMADNTNTWMLALKDPNADSYFTQSTWSLSKEVRARCGERAGVNTFAEMLLAAQAGVPGALPVAHTLRHYPRSAGAHHTPGEARVRPLLMSCELVY